MIYKRSIKQFFKGDPTLYFNVTFDGNVIDYGTGAHHGTILGTQITQSLSKLPFTQARRFIKANNNRVTWGALDWTGDFTFGFWVRTGAIQSDQIFFNREDDSTHGWMLTIRGNPGFKAGFQALTTSQSWREVVGNTTLKSNTEYFIVGAYKNSQYLKVYVNGILDGYLSTPYSYSPASNTNCVSGAYSNNLGSSAGWADGDLQEAFGFRRTLTNAEISAYYKWVVSPKKYFVFAEPSIINTRRRLLLSM